MNIESIKSLRDLYEDYTTIKKDLSIALRVGKKYHEIHHGKYEHVLYLMTDLLLTGFENIEDGKKFDLSTKLSAAYEVLEACPMQKTTNEIVLFKFARSFTLFMDNLHGTTLKKVERKRDSPSTEGESVEEESETAMPRLFPVATKRPAVKVMYAPPHLNYAPSGSQPIAKTPALAKTAANIRPMSKRKAAPQRLRVAPPLDSPNDPLRIPPRLYGPAVKRPSVQAGLSQSSTSPPVFNKQPIEEMKVEGRQALKKAKIEDDDYKLTMHEECLPSTSTASNGIVKEEVEDSYDYSAPHNSHDSHERSPLTYGESMDFHYDDLKLEMDDVLKEEPIEEPIADIVKLSEFSSAANGFVDPIDQSSLPSTSSTPPPPQSFSHRPRKQRHAVSPPPPAPPPPPSQPTQPMEDVEQRVKALVPCPHCNLEIADSSRLAQHMLLNHREQWIKYVVKCPETLCDFRTSDLDVLRRHKIAVHTADYYRRMASMGIDMKFGAKCPYCTKSIFNLMSFVSHMESHHPRLCTYTAQILTCTECRHTTSHTYEMLIHWLHKKKMCTKGIRFNYNIAANTKSVDEYREKDERERSRTIVMDR